MRLPAVPKLYGARETHSNRGMGAGRIFLLSSGVILDRSPSSCLVDCGEGGGIFELLSLVVYSFVHTVTDSVTLTGFGQ